MRAADQSEYIVQCIREGASMYEDDARKFLAEHDSHVQAQALSAAADEIDGAQQRLVVKKTVVNILRRRANQTEDGAPPAAEPDFFQPGRTYTEDAPFRAPEDRPNFQCIAVATHPTAGNRRALGFEQAGAGSPWRSSSMRDEEWADGWTDITDTTTRDSK